MAQHTSPEPRSLFQNAILTGSSWFGSGYFPKAPGTWGTVAAIPFWWLLAGLGPVLYAVVVAVFCGVAVYFSHEAEKIYGGHDSKKIVIDEVAGLLVAGLGVPFLWPQVVAAFLLFRLFDITKPWPVGWADEKVGGGWGVVLDDLIAGAMACGVMHLGFFIVGGWW